MKNVVFFLIFFWKKDNYLYIEEEKERRNFQVNIQHMREFSEKEEEKKNGFEEEEEWKGEMKLIKKRNHICLMFGTTLSSQSDNNFYRIF